MTKVYLLAIILLPIACTDPGNGKDSPLQNSALKSGGLYDTIVRLDSLLFDAFNNRNQDKLMAFFSEDLEFYHDLGGLTNYQQNMEAFKQNFNSDRKVRREIVKGSIEVCPIKGFGAVQTGIHRFYVTEKGQNEKLTGEAKFVHLWQNKASEWKITRVISYDHNER